MTEIDWANMNPNDWPHTPPLRVLQKLLIDDPNTFWRLSSGHIRNALDETLDALGEAERERDAALSSLVSVRREDGHLVHSVLLDHLLGVFRPGSQEWSWWHEYRDLMYREPDAMRHMIDSVRRGGILEPILLGDDGRVWDGHHRIAAAMHLGMDFVPVLFHSETQWDEAPLYSAEISNQEES